MVTSRPLAVPGVTSVASPRAALDYLASRGRSVALLAGGAQLHDAFLADDLVDELVFTVAPVLVGKGMQIALPQGRYRELAPASARELGGGLVQLRYVVRRS